LAVPYWRYRGAWYFRSVTSALWRAAALTLFRNYFPSDIFADVPSEKFFFPAFFALFEPVLPGLGPAARKSCAGAAPVSTMVHGADSRGLVDGSLWSIGGVALFRARSGDFQIGTTVCFIPIYKGRPPDRHCG